MTVLKKRVDNEINTNDKYKKCVVWFALKEILLFCYTPGCYNVLFLVDRAVIFTYYHIYAVPMCRAKPTIWTLSVSKPDLIDLISLDVVGHHNI